MNSACPQPHLPLEAVPAPQDLSDLLPAALLVLGVQGQAVEEPGDPAGGRVVAFEHERVHLSPELCI